MTSYGQTLEDILKTVQYLWDNQRLLNRVLSGRLEHLEFTFVEYEPQHGGEFRANIGIACGINPPIPPDPQPKVDSCFPLLLPPGTTQISVGDLAELTRRAGEWCDGISNAIQELIESQGSTTE